MIWYILIAGVFYLLGYKINNNELTKLVIQHDLDQKLIKKKRLKINELRDRINTLNLIIKEEKK
jgi:hypothetical protein